MNALAILGEITSIPWLYMVVQTHCPLKVQYHVCLINITMLFLLNTYNSYCCRVAIIFQLSINNLISWNKS